MKNYGGCWLFTTLGIILMMTSTCTTQGEKAVSGPVLQINPTHTINEKNEIIAQKGDNITIICRGKRPVNIKQQKRDMDLLGTFSEETELEISDDFDIYPYAKSLKLYNVNQFSVGYYACFYDTVDSDHILYVLEEPIDTENVTYIYMYVNDLDSEPELLAGMSDFAIKINSTHALIPCRPTMPDVNMKLTLTLARTTPEIIKVLPKIGFFVSHTRDSYKLVYQCNGSRGNYTSTKFARIRNDPECTGLETYRGPLEFMEGETFYLNCSVPYKYNVVMYLDWSDPRNRSEVIADNGRDVKLDTSFASTTLYKTIRITNATKEDAGSYICSCKSGSSPKQIKTEIKKFLTEPYIKMRNNNPAPTIKERIRAPTFKVEVKAYPKPIYTMYRNNQPVKAIHTTSRYNCSVPGAAKYVIEESPNTFDVAITVCNFTLIDIANYTLVANNTYKQENSTIYIQQKGSPRIEFFPSENITYLVLNQKKTMRCVATGFPLPTINWLFSFDDQPKTGIDTKMAEYKVESTITIAPEESLNVTCKATVETKRHFRSDPESVSVTKEVRVYEIPQGFGVIKSKMWYPEGEIVSLPCKASIYKFSNVSWLGPDGIELSENVNYHTTKLSHVGTLVFNGILVDDEGEYTCVGKHKYNGSNEKQIINIEVKAIREPNIQEPMDNRDEIVEKFQKVNFSCIVDAVPSPHIVWYKDNEMLQNDTNDVTIFENLNHTIAKSTVVIGSMKLEDQGKYECRASSGSKTSSRQINLKIAVLQPMPHKSTIIGSVLSIMLLLVALVVYLLWKVRKERQFRKELHKAGLLNFKKGLTKSLNPDLGIDEQAELLPYDEKFEFPAEKLKLGHQLGAGAFGVVYKAEARGIINAEETTPVAVKMVKKTADNMYIKALASELKIMVHLGKHINIVNLLGACTKNIGKRELSVIVEYCMFGNIHNYMQKHREVFIDQFTDTTEKSLGKVNRGFSCSSGSSGMNSDYFGAHSQATDHTVLNSTNTNRSERKDKQTQQEEFVKVSETGYVQPEWRSNYVSDYSYDGRSLRPLCSRDLLAWAFQIARGMEYLASRKILHGDLAARNVLLAEDNVVKICDFGLAKSIYKNDEYQKKENSPLPVRWLAIECMMDRIFTTQSDVWAFGIVLWELFSLAKTPYPNMSPQDLMRWLSEGKRLEKPPYADDRLYNVMMDCWAHKPTARPTFSQLQELLGSFLEDNVRNHYVDLNAAFTDMNVKRDGEDYLAMVSAPDYNNLVTPSPHHYVNEVRSFFPPTPTQVPLDEEGYLQMTPMNPSIFSPRVQSTKFDFDTKRLQEPRVAESRGGSESTPMLTLNNLSARSGSDSDHEGGHSPYLKMCPSIAEESDDVFKINENNQKNIHNGAVTNPTYISLGLDIDKKPQDINNYINIPNGLVK